MSGSQRMSVSSGEQQLTEPAARSASIARPPGWPYIVGTETTQLAGPTGPAGKTFKHKRGSDTNSINFGEDGTFKEYVTITSGMTSHSNGSWSLDEGGTVRMRYERSDRDVIGIWDSEKETVTIGGTTYQGPPKRPALANSSSQEGAASGSPRGIELASIVEGPQSYHMGIIDILQRWTVRKRLERLAKSWRRDAWAGISAVPPGEYAKRFTERVIFDVFDAPELEQEGV